MAVLLLGFSARLVDTMSNLNKDNVRKGLRILEKVYLLCNYLLN